jgi:hypothetical protein
MSPGEVRIVGEVPRPRTKHDDTKETKMNESGVECKKGKAPILLHRSGTGSYLMLPGQGSISLYRK